MEMMKNERNIYKREGDTAMNKTVNEIGNLSFTGNIINLAWFKNLSHDNGKANMNAIVILSEIIYWYKPTQIIDKNSGQLIGYKKKFKEDKLQKSYQSLANKFGITKGQAKAACKFLKDKGLIDIEFRNITTSSGQNLSNIMFIEPIVEEIKKISNLIEVKKETTETVHSSENEEISTNAQSKYTISAMGKFNATEDSRDVPINNKNIEEIASIDRDSEDTVLDLCNYNNTPMQFQPQTNTKITTKTTTEINTKNTTKTTTTKNIHRSSVEEIVDFLNLKAGTNYMSSTKETKNIINARLKEGFKVEDFFKVISQKTENWKETDYEKYLRPETLFGSKFESYVNEKPSKKAFLSSCDNKNTAGSFSNRKQRKYDIENLERGLLGWTS
jgi:uncharacterized phage protein (TIGR02220 family)